MLRHNKVSSTHKRSCSFTGFKFFSHRCMTSHSCNTPQIMSSPLSKYKVKVNPSTCIAPCVMNTTLNRSGMDHTVSTKWVPASAGKAKAGMVHSVSGWTRGLWDPLRTRAIPERLICVFTTRRYTNSRLPYLTLPYLQYDNIRLLFASLIYNGIFTRERWRQGHLVRPTATSYFANVSVGFNMLVIIANYWPDIF